MLVRYDPAALKDLTKIPVKIQKLITDRVDDLANNPRPLGWKQLSPGPPPRIRIRQGGYRISYTIEPNLVTVIAIGLRGEAYTKKYRRRGQ